MEVACRSRAGTGLDTPLLVLLPGAGMRAGDFETHGFLDDVHRTGAPIDIIAVETGMACYLDDTLAVNLHSEIMRPTITAPTQRVWLAGISAGGFGALRYAQAYPEIVEGVILIAPFLGSAGLIADIQRAGGLSAWRPASAETCNPQASVLAWLGDRPADPPASPTIYLGYGETDRFARAHGLLAARLPPDQCIKAPGGHDWPTWERLWSQLLAVCPLPARNEENTTRA